MSPPRIKRVLRSAAQLGLFGVVAMAASLVTTAPASASYASEINALQQQEGSLQSQLGALQGQAAAAGQQASQLSAQIATTEQQLSSAQAALSEATAALAQTEDKIATTQSHIDADRTQLANLVAQLYQHGASDSMTSALVDSSGITQFVDTTLQLQALDKDFSNLTEELLQEEASLKTLQRQQQTQEAAVATQVTRLQNQQSQLQAEQAQYQSEQAQLSGQAAELSDEIQSDNSKIQTLQDEEIASEGSTGSYGVGQGGTILSVGPPPSRPYATNPDNYPYGQCTWYVATQTRVPWAPWGNADEWVSLDLDYDAYPIGLTPRVGSMVVFAPGGYYAPGAGHVAWVVAVYGPQTFVVKEANVVNYGSGDVDTREIYSTAGVIDFIYG